MQKDYITEEVWKEIPGYDGLYEISNLGRVWSKRSNRYLKPVGSPYLSVNLTNKEGKSRLKQHHRLVLEAFVGPCPSGMVCCHWDGNRKNNKLDNLRWASYQENNSTDKGRQGALKTNEWQIRIIKRLWEEDHSWGCLIKIGKVFNIAGPSVGRIINKRRWKHI